MTRSRRWGQEDFGDTVAGVCVKGLDVDDGIRGTARRTGLGISADGLRGLCRLTEARVNGSKCDQEPLADRTGQDAVTSFGSYSRRFSPPYHHSLSVGLWMWHCVILLVTNASILDSQHYRT
jgi:hypothetical protein